MRVLAIINNKHKLSIEVVNKSTSSIKVQPAMEFIRDFEIPLVIAVSLRRKALQGKQRNRQIK